MPNIKTKAAPYSRELQSKPQKKSVVILTGADAWDIAKEKNTISDQPKLLLPFKQNPKAFSWPVSGRDCIIFGYGQPESHEIILRLSRCLLVAGAAFVVLCLPGKPITRINPVMEVAA